MALAEHGLSATAVSANSSQVGNVEAMAELLQRAGYCGLESRCNRVQAAQRTPSRGGLDQGAAAHANRTRAVSSPARELNPATLSTRLRAGPGVRGVERILQATPSCERASLR